MIKNSTYTIIKFLNLKNNHTAILFAVLIVSAALNFYNLNFPLGFHADEPIKIFFLQQNTQNFGHPILMLQLARMANLIFNFKNANQLILLGRSISAICGISVVFVIYLLAKKIFQQEYYALITAFACAVSPILVIHAHYYKEGIYFTLFALIFLLQLNHFREKNSRFNAALLGATLGLATSAEYMGLMLLFLWLLTPHFDAAVCRNNFYKKTAEGLIWFILVFLLVNYPLILHYQQFKSGLELEALHAARGHTLFISPWENYFCFHLLHSIIPGITISLTLLSALGVFFLLIYWRREPFLMKILLLFLLMYYLSYEISPLKPNPDFMRYMLVISPTLILFAVFAIKKIHQCLFNRGNQFIILDNLLTCTLIMVACAIPFYKTAKLDFYLCKDTRLLAGQWLSLHYQQTAIYGYYVLNNDDPHVARQFFDLTDMNAIKEAQKNHIRYLMLSSFHYQRYLDGLKMLKQSPQVYALGNFIQSIFNQYEYIEITPKYKSFGFSNPTIRIIDLESKR